jgi:hypothetical protein
MRGAHPGLPTIGAFRSEQSRLKGTYRTIHRSLASDYILTFSILHFLILPNLKIQSYDPVPAL